MRLLHIQTVLLQIVLQMYEIEFVRVRNTTGAEIPPHINTSTRTAVALRSPRPLPPPALPQAYIAEAVPLVDCCKIM